MSPPATIPAGMTSSSSLLGSSPSGAHPPQQASRRLSRLGTHGLHRIVLNPRHNLQRPRRHHLLMRLLRLRCLVRRRISVPRQSRDPGTLPRCPVPRLQQRDLSITDYCRRLKRMVDDLGETVTDRTLILNLVRGLNERYANIGLHLRRSHPFHSYLEAKDALLLEELALKHPISTPTALVASHTYAHHQSIHNSWPYLLSLSVRCLSSSTLFISPLGGLVVPLTSQKFGNLSLF